MVRADDVFYLTPEELQTGQDGDLKSLVQARQAEMEHFRSGFITFRKGLRMT